MKKVLSILLVILMTASLYGCGNSTDSPSTPSDPVDNTQQSNTEDIPQESALDQGESEPDETTEPITEASLDDLCDIIELVSEGNYEDFDVFNDGENTITMNIRQDGLAAELALAMDANDESVKQLWETLKESMIDVCNSTCDLIDTAGREDVSFLLNILNDTNHENVLLSITEGVVIYDVMEEYSSASAPATPSVSQTDSATASQKSALSQAKNYLKVSAFSYEGLIDQLEYEKYTHEDAVYAADNCGADWNEQALQSAKSYLKLMEFSYEGLIDQLGYEKYTTEQATYAADNCGADWNEQAVKKAESYLSIMSFSRDELISQLEYEGFTHAQAVYGAEQNGY
ncbi:MAG: hypothetical protein HDT16_01565 [Oscillibacter sp.]|nr:hypothetical protein [Oscillibacter sp.]